MSSHHSLRRLGLLLSGCVLVAGSLAACGEDESGTAGSASSAAEYDEATAAAAAEWITSELDDGLLSYSTDYGPYVDHGLSIDAALALDEIGGHDEIVQEISDAVAGGLDSYVSGEAFGDPGSTYAGPTAKALVMAQVAGEDPAGYGGADLVARLESVTSDKGVTTGRIEDMSTFGDNANVLGQALAVQGLAGAGSARTGDATAFLLEQQCADGSFRLQFAPDKKAGDQSCDGGTAKESASDVDATAQAVLALQDVTDEPGVEEALESATAWLLEEQGSDGAFGGSGADTVDNTNSTGLAGWALGVREEDAAAESAAAWVRTMQAGGDGDCEAWEPSQIGAVAYDEKALVSALEMGISKATAGQWLRATVQALPVLEWAPADDTDPCEVSG